MSRILSIMHPDGGTSGVLHDGAAAAGHEIEEWCPALAPEPPRPLGGYAALLVLGGEQNVCEQDRYPYLTGEIALLRSWLSAGRPVLGICLGAQLIAEATGGSVVRASEREVGWPDVELTDAGRADPVIGFGEPRFASLQWHTYAVELPPGAQVLARSPVCVQAFRLGEAWGLQYHPEVTGEILEGWFADMHDGDGDPLTRERDEAAIRSGLAEHLPGWNAYGSELFRRFAARLR